MRMKLTRMDVFVGVLAWVIVGLFVTGFFLLVILIGDPTIRENFNERLFHAEVLIWGCSCAAVICLFWGSRKIQKQKGTLVKPSMLSFFVKGLPINLSFLYSIAWFVVLLPLWLYSTWLCTTDRLYFIEQVGPLWDNENAVCLSVFIGNERKFTAEPYFFIGTDEPSYQAFLAAFDPLKVKYRPLQITCTVDDDVSIDDAVVNIKKLYKLSNNVAIYIIAPLEKHKSIVDLLWKERSAIRTSKSDGV